MVSFFKFFCSKNANVARAYLAAPGARRCSRTGLGGSRRGAAQDGDLRDPTDQLRDPPRRYARVRLLLPGRSRGDQHHLRRSLRHGPDGFQEVDRVLVDQSHGLRHVRHGHADAAGDRRCGPADVQPRNRDRDALPVGRGDQAKMMKKMRGELAVRKSDSCIEYLEITNPEPFRPQITVKLNRFFSRFDFGSPTSESAAVGATCENIVPLGTQFEMDMKALGLMNIDVSVRATYSNFVLYSGA